MSFMPTLIDNLISEVRREFDKSISSCSFEQESEVEKYYEENFKE